MLGIERIVVKKLAGEIRAPSAMKESLVLTADSYRAFTVKRMTVGCDAAAATGSLSKRATGAAEAASRVNDLLIRPLFHLDPNVSYVAEVVLC